MRIVKLIFLIPIIVVFSFSYILFFISIFLAYFIKNLSIKEANEKSKELAIIIHLWSKNENKEISKENV